MAASAAFAQTIRYVTTTGINSNPANATSWATSTTNLQGAIDAVAAAGGGEVWVAEGVYKPGGNNNTDRTISFAMKNKVIIYGGYRGNETSKSQRPPISLENPSSTTLSGDINSIGSAEDNSYHVIYNTALDSSAVMDGFVVQDGNATEEKTIEGDNVSGITAGGGGVYNNGSGSAKSCYPAFTHCAFINNKAGYGGAIYNNGFQGFSGVKLTDCFFRDNKAEIGGGAIFYRGENGACRIDLKKCSFQSNTALGNGGAIDSRGQSGKNDLFISDCLFLSNKGTVGGAINIFADEKMSCRIENTSFIGNSYFVPYSTDSNGGTVNIAGAERAVFSNCIFYHNSANNAGAIRMYSLRGMTEGYFYNCLFRDNTANNLGAAFWITDVKAFFVNCTIIQHPSAAYGCVYLWSWNRQAECHFINSVLWDNGGTNTFIRRGDGLLTVDNSIIDPRAISYSGTNNKTSNPLFVDPQAGDFHLQVCSPGVNTGNTALYAGGPSTDLDNNPRIRQDQVDIGAYERQEGNCRMQLAEPQYDCKTGEFYFRSLKGEDGPVYYSAIGITGWSTSAGPYVVKPSCDAEPFRLQAYQAGKPDQVVTYFWNYTATCPSICNPGEASSGTSTQPLTLLAPDYNCSTGAFRFRSVGGDGSPVSYKAIGITDWNQSAETFSVKPACDVQPFILQARQASQPAISYTYYWDYVKQCRQNCPDITYPVTDTTLQGCASPASTIGQPLQLLPPVYNCQTGEISVKATGGNGNIIEYRLVGDELISFTSSCALKLTNPALLAAIRDPSQPAPAFFIQARQYNADGSITLVAYPWNPQASCRGAGRQADHQESSLEVHARSNPTLADGMDIDIVYNGGTNLSVEVYNLQGQRLYNNTLALPAHAAQLRVPLGQSAGVYLLRVCSPTQQRTVKLIRQ